MPYSRMMRTAFIGASLFAIASHSAVAQTIALSCAAPDAAANAAPQIYEVTDKLVTLNGKPVPTLHITITDLFVTWDHSTGMNYAINTDKSGNCDSSRNQCYEHRTRGLEVRVDRRTGAMETVKITGVDKRPEQREITTATCEQFKPGPVKF